MAEEIKEVAAAEAEAPKKRGRKPAAEKAAPAAEKAPAAKKAADPKASVVIEYAGKQIAAKEVLAAAQKAYKKANKGAVIRKIEIYIKPEENCAYYVVNGEAADDFKVEL